MNEIICTLNAATEKLEDQCSASSEGLVVTTRDWAAFFESLSKLLATLLPLIIPLFAKTKSE